MKSESKETLVNSSHSLDSESSNHVDGQKDDENEFDNVNEIVLTQIEKQYLLSAERGDCPTVRKLIREYKDKPEILNINCRDSLERSALISAIENENIELIKLLLEEGIEVKDSLLHAIKEEYVEAVETLLCWEEEHHKPGDPYSWEAVDRCSSSFTQDITPISTIFPLIIHGARIIRIIHGCACDDCVISSETDSLRHSQSRINAYKALSSSSLIALSSRDPILTAFELSWELRRLSRMETEFRQEYQAMRKKCQDFATSLLDHARTSNELEIMLNYNPHGENWEPGERQTLERLKFAIKFKQKMFVAHPNVQQLLAAIWYEGLPGFRRKGFVGQIFQVAKLAAMFPIYCTIYMLAPNSTNGKFMKKPFVKFITHSASYAFFLTLLGAASQRVEFLLLEWFGPDWVQDILQEWKKHERGALPGIAETFCILYIIGLIWGEIRSLYADGFLEYVSDLWNIVDFISNSFYVAWISLRFSAWYTVQQEAKAGLNPWIPREQWSPFEPMLLSEGAFAAGMIFSFLKLVHIFSINPHLGPLQVSLGRMIIDILKFFFIYTLVLFAFGCGLNQLLWYYADLEKQKCYRLPNGLPDFDNNEKACTIWRRFANLFETSQSLFWASFGLVDLMAFDLAGIKSFTRFWALLMFGSYSVINIIVLLNMLIAMMSNSYQIISERSDSEWKFARSHLWISYFDDGSTLPPPFNLFPTVKILFKMFRCGSNNNKTKSVIRRSRDKARKRHDNVMKLLVRRYVCDEQRKRDDFGITEDDIMEVRQDISTLRYEILDIFQTNGYKTPNIKKSDGNVVAGKKGKMMERRILKDFQIGFVADILSEQMQSSGGQSKDVFSTLANIIGKRASSKMKKEQWNAMARKNTSRRDPIGSTSEALSRQRTRQSLRKHIVDASNQGLQMDTENLVLYNPNLTTVSHPTRVAYAKFMHTKIKKELRFNDEEPSTEVVNEKSTSTRSSIRRIPIDANNVAQTIGILKSASIEKEDTLSQDAKKHVEIKPEPEIKTEDTSKDESDNKIEETASIKEELSKDFRSRTPIQEDPLEDVQSPGSECLSPDLLSPKHIPPPVARPSSPIPPSSPPKSPKTDSPTVKLRIDSIESVDEENEPISKSKSPSPSKIGEESPRRLSIIPENPVSFTSDKGKSKTTGKTISGWL